MPVPQTVTGELRGLLTVAAPLVLAQLAQNGMSFVDTVMIGRLGAIPLAGLALGAVAFNFVYLLVMALVLVVSPLVAQAVGAGDDARATKVGRHGLVLALALAAPAALVVANLVPVLRLTGQDAVVLAGADEYLRAVALGLPGALAFVALRGFLEGNGQTRPIMFIAGTGVLFNAGLNEVLIFGRLGAPALGLAGAGYATSVTYTLMAAATALVISDGYGHLRPFRGWRLDGRLLREAVTLGWPISLTLGFEVGLFSAAALIMGTFGGEPLAGHQIAMQMTSLSFMVPLGVSIATSVRVGQAVGRRDPDGVRRAGWLGVAVAASFMVMTACLYVFAPRLVTSVFIDVTDPANLVVVRYAATFLTMAGAFQVFDGVQVAAVGALRGLKDTRIPMLITLLSYWVVGFVTGLVCAFWLDMGPRGMWFGLLAGLACAATLLSLRFRALTAGRAAVSAAAGA